MMRLSIYHYFLTALFMVFSTTINYACNVDVTILEGNALTLCANTPNSLNASAGYTQYIWSGAATGTSASTSATSDGWAVVSATDNLGCISKDSIFVTLFPSSNPQITSSEGVNICPTIGGTTLSLNQTFTSQIWSDGTTNPTLFITAPGNYKAYVIDANGCPDSAEITVDFITFSLNAIGTSTVCIGSSLILEASGGSLFAWNTNEFSESIVVAPTEPTTYSVTIYEGACFETLSIDIDVAQLAAHNLPDTVYVLPGTTEYVTGPPNFDSYIWQPATLVTTTTGNTTGYSGNTSGDITLVATNNTIGCAITHSIHFKLIELTIPEGFSPNGDGINDLFEIPEIQQFDASLKVWNRWGDLVYTSDNYSNDWDGTCKTSFCIGSKQLPEGTYFYSLTVEGNRFDAYVTIKL